jgi:hypothetical protein
MVGNSSEVVATISSNGGLLSVGPTGYQNTMLGLRCQISSTGYKLYKVIDVRQSDGR